MRTISAGVIVINERGEVLLGHATYQPHWDIFKGGIDAGETPLEAAIREMREESGLSIQAADLVEIGEIRFSPKKDLHLYMMRVQSDKIDLTLLKCTSMVQMGAHVFPEMDAYKWVAAKDVPLYCAKNMARVLTTLLTSGA